MTKAGGDRPVNTTGSPTTASSTRGEGRGMEVKLDGTYKIEKEKHRQTGSWRNIEETATIKKLTDDALEIEDKDKKVDVFKKKK